MAETKDLPEAAAIFGKMAQHLSQTGEEPPESYIWTNITEIDAPLATDIPVIEFSLLVSSTDAELKALHSALTKWGCFQVVAFLPFLCMLFTISNKAEKMNRFLTADS